jgi:hypothetical protein
VHVAVAADDESVLLGGSTAGGDGGFIALELLS